MFSTGQESTLQGSAATFSGCALWKANYTEGHVPEARHCLCCEKHTVWNKDPQGLWHSSWQKELCMVRLQNITSSVSLPACQQKLGASGISRQTELGKRETENSWLSAQASNHTAILCISLCIWAGVLFGVVLKNCVFTQGPVLYIACLLMLPCCVRSLLFRRSALLTLFVIVLSHLLLEKGLVFSSWHSTEFAIHYISNSF